MTSLIRAKAKNRPIPPNFIRMIQTMGKDNTYSSIRKDNIGKFNKLHYNAHAGVWDLSDLTRPEGMDLWGVANYESLLGFMLQNDFIKLQPNEIKRCILATDKCKEILGILGLPVPSSSDETCIDGRTQK